MVLEQTAFVYLKVVCFVLCGSVLRGSAAQHPPTLIKSPKDVIYREYTPIELECVVDYEDVQYIWKFGQQDLNLAQPGQWKFSGEGGSIRLEFSISTLHDGYYQCFANTSRGQATSDVVTVRRASLIVSKSEKQENVTIGQYLKIDCQFMQVFPPPTTTWSRTPQDKSVGAPITLSDRVRVDGKGALHFGYVLKEDEIRNPLNNQELYKCDVKNNILDQIKGSSYTKLTVTGDGEPTPEAPKERFEEETEIVAIRSETLTMRCFFSGYPNVTIAWDRVDGDQDDVRHKILNGNTSYELSDVQDSDAGKYRCIGSNSEGSAIKEFNVTVEAKPNFTKPEDQPHDVNVTQGHPVTIKCQADAIPDATVTWFINGQPINTSIPVDRRRFKDDHTLVIDNVCRDCDDGTSDVMVIQCNASNLHGHAFGQGYLNVLNAINEYSTTAESFLEETTGYADISIVSDEWRTEANLSATRNTTERQVTEVVIATVAATSGGTTIIIIIVIFYWRRKKKQEEGEKASEGKLFCMDDDKGRRSTIYEDPPEPDPDFEYTYLQIDDDLSPKQITTDTSKTRKMVEDIISRNINDNAKASSQANGCKTKGEAQPRSQVGPVATEKKPVGIRVIFSD